MANGFGDGPDSVLGHGGDGSCVGQNECRRQKGHGECATGHLKVGLTRVKLTEVSQKLQTEEHAQQAQFQSGIEVHPFDQTDFNPEEQGNEVGGEVEEPVSRRLE